MSSGGAAERRLVSRGCRAVLSPPELLTVRYKEVIGRLDCRMRISLCERLKDVIFAIGFLIHARRGGRAINGRYNELATIAQVSRLRGSPARRLPLPVIPSPSRAANRRQVHRFGRRAILAGHNYPASRTSLPGPISLRNGFGVPVAVRASRRSGSLREVKPRVRFAAYIELLARSTLASASLTDARAARSLSPYSCSSTGCCAQIVPTQPRLHAVRGRPSARRCPRVKNRRWADAGREYARHSLRESYPRAHGSLQRQPTARSSRRCFSTISPAWVGSAISHVVGDIANGSRQGHNC